MNKEKSERKYVERIRYEGFESEEEARKFLEETNDFFYEVHTRMMQHFRDFFRGFEDFWVPFEPKPRKYYVKVGEDVKDRLEKLERDVSEIKEILVKKYIKKKKKAVA